LNVETDSSARRGATRPQLVPRVVLDQLERGDIETVNLMEQIALDMKALAKNLFNREHPKLGSPRLLERMSAGGKLVLETHGRAVFDDAIAWTSDTARGWAAMAVGLAPRLELDERLLLARRFAADAHFAVREWAWIGVRGHVCVEPLAAVRLLEGDTVHESPYLRRFASELTRPIGVWSRHIPLLKREPWHGLPILEPLASDGHRYVSNSVGNWLNDASRTQPEWVVQVSASWLSRYGDDCARTTSRGTRTIRKRLPSNSGQQFHLPI
jgi:3-methyladenine DNA glycosylase AlkC